MKKYAMMAVKGCIGLLPLSVKNQLKKNAALTDLYSRSLQRSGLFYGFPSARKMFASYQQCLKRQHKLIEELSDSTSHEVDVVVWGCTRLIDTLNALQQSIGVVRQVLIIGGSVKSGASIWKEQYIEDINALREYLSDDIPVVLVNAGDILLPAAVNLMRNALGEADAIYCDTDELNRKQLRHQPRFLPDWNPDLHLSTGYVRTGVMVAKPVSALRSIGEVNSRQSIAGLLTAYYLAKPNAQIRHLPLALLTTSSNKELSRFVVENEQLLAEHHVVSFITPNKGVLCHQWPVLHEPLVSLIIPTKDAIDLVRNCIDSILDKTLYKRFEIILVNNNSEKQESLDYFASLNKHPQIKVLNYPRPFNYSAINNFAVKQASGEVIGLINNDIEVISPQWLIYMVGHVLREDIGCVGAKLLYPDGRIQHAGVVMGYGGGAGHAHKYFPRYHPGYMNRLVATQNYSAVTAACLLVKKNHYEAVGGLNEVDLQVAFNDVDFCLKVAELGVRNLYCAEAELYHHESVSRGLDTTAEKAARFNRELEYLQSKWKNYIDHDPAYNPNLTLRRENFSIREPSEY